MKNLLFILLCFTSLAQAQREREVLAEYLVKEGWINGYEYTEETLESDTRIQVFQFRDAPQTLWLEMIWLEDGTYCIGPLRQLQIQERISESEEFYAYYRFTFQWDFIDHSEETSGTAPGQIVMMPGQPDYPNMGVSVQFLDFELEYAAALKGNIHPDLLQEIENLPMEEMAEGLNR